MGKFIIGFVISYSLFFTKSYADELSGTWKFEKEAWYGVPVATPLDQAVIQIVDGHFLLKNGCVATVQKSKKNTEGYWSGAKGGPDRKQTLKYVQDKFGIDLEKVKAEYRVSSSKELCADPFYFLYVFEDKLINGIGAGEFYSFTRSDGETKKPLPSNVNLYGRNLSHLPFNLKSFYDFCIDAEHKLDIGKCTPVYAPYWAKSTDPDPLAKAIGTHDYNKYLGTYAGRGYENPFAYDLKPFFVILPPLNDVLIVHVSDREQGEKFGRDGIHPVYITIKNLKVVDQIDAECNISKDYFCINDEGKKQYQLLPSGKFKKLN